MANTQSRQVWEDYRARKEAQRAGMYAKVHQLHQLSTTDTSSSFTDTIARAVTPDGYQTPPEDTETDLDPHRPLGHYEYATPPEPQTEL